MNDEQTEIIHDARRAERRLLWLERFYYTHPPLLLAALALGIEGFTIVSLLYTTIVTAITAGATYGAKRKAVLAQIAGYENP